MDSKLVEAGDRFLDAQAHSQDAYKHVLDVYNKFDHLVSLALNRALEELQIPENVIPIQRHPRYSHTASTKEGA